MKYRPNPFAANADAPSVGPYVSVMYSAADMKTATLPHANGIPERIGTIQWIDGRDVQAEQNSLKVVSLVERDHRDRLNAPDWNTKGTHHGTVQTLFSIQTSLSFRLSLNELRSINAYIDQHTADSCQCYTQRNCQEWHS